MLKLIKSSAARRNKMNHYIPNISEDEEQMLKDIGVDSVDALFDDIPEDIRLNRELNIGKPMSELELTKYIKGLSEKNINLDKLTCFLGAGAYDHFIPAVVKHIVSRSEFYTAYTPYQAEISQGTLQSIFEYQTMICALTGMDVANASMYDGATACAEAAKMAAESTRRKTVMVSRTVNPEVRRVLKTYMHFKGIELIEADEKDGVTDLDALKNMVDKNTAGVIVQNPNFFGIVEDYTELGQLLHQNKGLLIMNVNPIAMGVLKSPADMGADIVIGEGQPLGNSISFGGPYLGFMATTDKLLRKMPGRVVGETIDVDGKRAYVLTIQAREQHIRREKATSNICSNEALNALSAVVYLACMGKKGLKETAVQCTEKAHYAYDRLIESGRFKPVFSKPFFNEFVLKSDICPEKINEELLKHNISGGYNVGKVYPLYDNTLMFCVTEKRTKQEIDNLVSVMEGIK